ncbi:alpha/beta fold hydrolase [Nocardia aurea]|uniref:alpha/beta fold hydrolase n=1 Tax=Nocardia aurea TaxID=2144174 RepID=UPI0033A7B6A5
MVTRKFATATGDLAYDDLGSGDPVVLLHATLHDRRDFAPIIPALARKNRVIALDWPGHGESAPTATLSAALLADTLDEFVTGLDLRRAVLVGNSVGGYAAAKLAIDHPDRVAGLVLVNTGGFIPRNPFVHAFCAALGTPRITRRVMPLFIRSYMKAAGPADEAIIERATAAARTPAGTAVAAALWRSFNDKTFDLRDRADRITAPTLIVWGTRDTAIPTRVGRRTHRAITQSRLHELPTGHVVFSSAPQEFLALTQPFIRSLTALRDPDVKA